LLNTLPFFLSTGSAPTDMGILAVIFYENMI
jgi:hypothetical protein